MCITFTFNIHSSEQDALVARTVQNELSKNEEKNGKKMQRAADYAANQTLSPLTNKIQ